MRIMVNDKNNVSILTVIFTIIFFILVYLQINYDVSVFNKIVIWIFQIILVIIIISRMEVEVFGIKK